MFLNFGSPKGKDSDKFPDFTIKVEDKDKTLPIPGEEMRQLFGSVWGLKEYYEFLTSQITTQEDELPLLELHYLLANATVNEITISFLLAKPRLVKWSLKNIRDEDSGWNWHRFQQTASRFDDVHFMLLPTESRKIKRIVINSLEDDRVFIINIKHTYIGNNIDMFNMEIDCK
ncbi:hypothetical protein WR25_20134 [Diploscapter pachys]|uniref:Uncharacterized protein n=1 Tax=Diploscapter pachys TaxID=2018661 RepID=A0A2A2LRQ1_9BILA|nr:hypothetical protein WR25_20134 [Diploscapter pachys]